MDNTNEWLIEEPTLPEINVLPIFDASVSQEAPNGPDRWAGVKDSEIRQICRAGHDTQELTVLTFADEAAVA